MNAQFHTPSFGDEVFDLTEAAPQQTMESANANKYQPGPGEKAPTSEPAKPTSAYGLFFRDTISAIKAQKPETSFDDICKIVRSMWLVLDPVHKNVYNKKTENARKEYIKQITAYRNSMRLSINDDSSVNNYEQDNAIQHPNISPKSGQIASRPAVFTINRHGSDQSVAQHDPQTTTAPTNNIVYCNNANAQTTQDDITTNDDSENEHVLNEDGSIQICIRENCNKRAVVNPDWEDEYCSNECVVVHCRNVFNQWVKTNMEGQV